jgi:hypothetical protein
MSKQDKKRDNYLRVAYILLKIAPYAIEKYVDKHYSGGFIGALRDKAHILKEKATPDQRKILLMCVRVMVFNATFHNISVISWRSVLLVEETGVPGENHRPVASH